MSPSRGAGCWTASRLALWHVGPGQRCPRGDPRPSRFIVALQLSKLAPTDRCGRDGGGGIRTPETLVSRFSRPLPSTTRPLLHQDLPPKHGGERLDGLPGRPQPYPAKRRADPISRPRGTQAPRRRVLKNAPPRRRSQVPRGEEASLPPRRTPPYSSSAAVGRFQSPWSRPSSHSFMISTSGTSSASVISTVELPRVSSDR